MLLLGAAAWAGALAVLWLPDAWGWVGLGAVSLGLAGWGWRRALATGWRGLSGPAGLLLVLVAVAATSALHVRALAGSPVSVLASQGAAVRLVLSVDSDPRTTRGPFGPQVSLRATVHEVTGRGRHFRVRTPVVVLADEQWAVRRLGELVVVPATLAPAEGSTAALVRPRGTPEVRAPPAAWWDGAAALRASVRAGVASRGEHESALLPALVDGDDAELDEALADDFRVTGLTHLTAVSGTNLTIVVGALLLLGRWLGVRGRWMWLLGACGVVGFVLLARTEPSVVRAAAMGSVALVGMGSNGLSRGVRCLGVAVLGLLLVDPWLATTVGFALSVLATAGILLLAPRWRDALQRWLPRWISEAVAVPLAAQVACTPLVAGVSGQVSLVAVLANLLVGPAVAPATVLGLLGGLAGLAWPLLGELVAWPGAWCVRWIVEVAQWGAGLPTASVGWGTGALALTLLTLACAAGAWAAPLLLGSRGLTLGCCVLLGVVVCVRPPTPGWPPRGWVVVMCDVGQGDATVLRAGPGSAVLVDAGPDPAAVDRCLRDLGIERLPLVVLTHFHADHVDGLAGAVADREVGAVVATWFAEPVEGRDAVLDSLGRAPDPVSRGLAATVGSVELSTLWPPAPTDPGLLPRVPEDANDSSVVLLADVGGVRILLTGDVEPDAQRRLAELLPGLEVDVLKVPHHGSRFQDTDWLVGLRASAALVGVGADNGYGHPASELLTALAAAGAEVGRTDVHGDLAVVADGEEVSLLARGG